MILSLFVLGRLLGMLVFEIGLVDVEGIMRFGKEEIIGESDFFEVKEFKEGGYGWLVC